MPPLGNLPVGPSVQRIIHSTPVSPGPRTGCFLFCRAGEVEVNVADTYAAEEPFGTIIKLLEQQRANLEHWPYTPDQLDRHKQISARLHELCDQLHSQR